MKEEIFNEVNNSLTICKGYLDLFDLKNEKKSLQYLGILTNEINSIYELINNQLIVKTEFHLEELFDDIRISLINSSYSDTILFKDNNIKITSDYLKLKYLLLFIINKIMNNNDQNLIILKANQVRKHIIITINSNIIIKNNDFLKEIDFNQKKLLATIEIDTSNNETKYLIKLPI